jgi:ABC-type polysaccharide/polyol phosphate export permease
MFRARTTRSTFSIAFGMVELIYHSVVREIRKSHRSAVVGLLLIALQGAAMTLVFFAVFQLLGLRMAKIRGDFLLYLMSGIFLFMTHNKTVSAVMSAPSATSAMMQHASLNPIITICAAAIAALYQQVLSLGLILFGYHALFNPITIDQPIGALGALLLAWFSGVAVGIIFLAITPWAPRLIPILRTVYLRANMITSGKMFVANTLPGYMLAMFDWNPLFHSVDQARGFIFINYTPHFTSMTYPLYLSLSLLVIGLMLEFFTRQRASASWQAGV